MQKKKVGVETARNDVRASRSIRPTNRLFMWGAPEVYGSENCLLGFSAVVLYSLPPPPPPSPLGRMHHFFCLFFAVFFFGFFVIPKVHNNAVLKVAHNLSAVLGINSFEPNSPKVKDVCSQNFLF
jgi:hypothetical protein